eukprot:g8756.t1
MGLCRVIVAVSTAASFPASGSVTPVEQLPPDRPRDPREQQLVKNTGSATGFRPESDQQQLRDCLFSSGGQQQRQDVSRTSCCRSTTAPPLDVEPLDTEVDPEILHLQRQVREALPPFLEKVAIKLEWNHKGGVLFARFDERLYVYRRKERDHTVYTLDPIARWKLWRDRLLFDTEIRYFQTEIRKQESKVRKMEEEAAKLQKSIKEWAGEMKTGWGSDRKSASGENVRSVETSDECRDRAAARADDRGGSGEDYRVVPLDSDDPLCARG